MKPIFKFFPAFFILFNLFAQESMDEIYPKFYGLTKDVKYFEEAVYEFDETSNLPIQSSLTKVTYKNGKAVLNEFSTVGDYSSESKTYYTYDANGNLISKVYDDITYGNKTTYSYEYQKGKLIKETYKTEYSNSITLYEYDSKGRILKATLKSEDGEITGYYEYKDYGKTNDSYTQVYKYLADGEVLSTATTQYVNGKKVLYKSESDSFGSLEYTYQYDSNNNIISSMSDGEPSEKHVYEYVGSNFIKEYYSDYVDYYGTEEFKFRKITFNDGKTIGSTEANMDFINANNVIDEDMGYDENGENLAELNNGNCESGDCQNGYGKESYDAGQEYEGFFKDGKRNGPGILKYGDGSSYNGMWEEGVKTGVGMYDNGDNSYFLGYHKNDLRDGYGYDQTANEDGTYDFQGNIWEGGNSIEEFGFASTGNSDGCINGDCSNGFGRYVFSNDDVYLGYYKNDTFNLFGVYIYTNGDVYIGSYINGKRNGFGMYVWADKSIYYGEYQNDTYHGLGAFLSNDGKNQIGEFKNGVLAKSME